MIPMPPSAMPQMMAPPMRMPTEDEIEEAQQIADACTWEEISAVLRSDDRRNYTIDIETTATTFEDDQVEKQARIEYVTAVTDMMEKWVPAIQGNPSLAPFAKELILFGAGAFKIGRTLEETLEDAFDQIRNAPPQPNPEAEKMKMEMQQAQQQHQMDMQAKMADVQAQKQKSALDLQAKQADLGMKQQSAAMDMQSKQQDIGLKQFEAKLDFIIKQMEMQHEREKMAMEGHKMQLEQRNAEHQAAIDRSQAVFDANVQRQMAEDKRVQQQQLAEDRRKQMAQNKPQ